MYDLVLYLSKKLVGLKHNRFLYVQTTTSAFALLEHRN